MGWIRDTILGGADADHGRPRRDPDFGTAHAPPGPAHPVAPPDAREVEEQLLAPAERCDEVSEAIETALHGPPDPLHPDIGAAGLGFVRGVLMRVLAHVVAAPGKADER